MTATTSPSSAGGGAAVSLASSTSVLSAHASGLSEDQKNILRRFVGGTLGGFLQAITSHPLDTMKARLQTGMHPNLMACGLATWREEGLRGFFRGVQIPLLFGGVFNSVLFSLNQLMQNVVSPADRKPHEPLALWRTALAAQMATPFYVMVLTPIERIKVVLQVEDTKGRSVGLGECVRRVYDRSGLKGFMRGYCPSVGVHLIGLPSYFVGYQVTRAALCEYMSQDSSAGRLLLPVLSGISAGIFFWVTSYPFDLIKTRMQASHHHHHGMRHVFYDVYRGGFFSLYKGLSVSLLRSAPANASVWIGLEYTQRIMQAYDL